MDNPFKEIVIESIYVRPFTGLSQLLSFIQEKIQREQGSIDSYLKSALEDEDVFSEEDYYMFAYEFPQRLRQGVILILYSLMVSNLKVISEHLHKKKGIALGYEDISNGNGEIERARIYLDKALGLNLTGLKWEPLDDLRKLRNIIVHKNATINENKFKKLFAKYE